MVSVYHRLLFLFLIQCISEHIKGVVTTTLASPPAIVLALVSARGAPDAVGVGVQPAIAKRVFAATR